MARLLRETTTVRLSQRERDLTEKAAEFLGQPPNEFIRYSTVQTAIALLKDAGLLSSVVSPSQGDSTDD